MTGFPTMSIIFGVIFALVGLVLAVLLGLALYPDMKHRKTSEREPAQIVGEAKNP